MYFEIFLLLNEKMAQNTHRWQKTFRKFIVFRFKTSELQTHVFLRLYCNIKQNFWKYSYLFFVHKCNILSILHSLANNHYSLEVWPHNNLQLLYPLSVHLIRYKKLFDRKTTKICQHRPNISLQAVMLAWEKTELSTYP